MTGSSTSAIGAAAEERAVAMLRDAGYEIVERNYRCPVGELDVIAREGGDLVFVEIRSRENDEHGAAELTVGPRKQQRIALVARHYLGDRKPRAVTIRFDVVGITGGDIALYRDAFRLGEFR